MKNNSLFYLLSFFVSIGLWFEASGFQQSYDIYPKIIIFLLAAMSLACFIQTLYQSKGDIKKCKNNNLLIFSNANLLRPGLLICFIVIYVFAITKIGYFLSTFCYLIIFLAQKRMSNQKDNKIILRGILIDLCVSLIAVLLIWLVFKVSLRLVFPQAILF